MITHVGAGRPCRRRGEHDDHGQCGTEGSLLLDHHDGADAETPDWNSMRKTRETPAKPPERSSTFDVQVL